MTDLARFAVLVFAAAVVFVTVLVVVLRKRPYKPIAAFCWLAAIVVVGGMVFARYGHILANLPWWIYYGAPALTTFFLPPIALRMNREEVGQYIPSAVLIGPFIHVVFSLFVGWHDYMPFPFRIPSLFELLH